MVFSPPHPHPQRQQKSPARGQQNFKKQDLDDFYGYYEKSQKRIIDVSSKNKYKSYIGWWMVQILVPIAPPIPIPGVNKSLLPGGKQIRKNTCLMIFMKKVKRCATRGLKKGSLA